MSPWGPWPHPALTEESKVPRRDVAKIPQLEGNELGLARRPGCPWSEDSPASFPASFLLGLAPGSGLSCS